MPNIDIDGNRVLREAVSEVFETMVFMDVAPLRSDEGVPDGESSVLSSISFGGTCEGSLSLLCSEESAKMITMTVLAMDDPEEVEESDIPDAMGELANMTMGSVKSRLYEKCGELSVSVPSVITGSDMMPTVREDDRHDEALVEIDGLYPMKLNLVYALK